MGGGGEYNLLIGPPDTIVASGVADFTFPAGRIHYFKIHMPLVIRFDHEGIRDKAGRYIGYVRTA